MSELGMGSFRRIQQQWFTREILHQAQGVIEVFFGLTQDFPGETILGWEFSAPACRHLPPQTIVGMICGGFCFGKF